MALVIFAFRSATRQSVRLTSIWSGPASIRILPIDAIVNRFQFDNRFIGFNLGQNIAGGDGFIFATSHWAILPLSMVGDRAGIRILTAILLPSCAIARISTH